MADLDPLVAQILLKGDDEFLGKLNKVATEGAERFEKLNEAVKNNASSAQVLTGALGLIEAAIAGVTAATILFIEKQTELSQNTKLLADAFGTTGEQLQGIEQIFAASGVKVEQFERFAVRLTTTIAREWPQLAASIRTFADESDASHLRVQNAILRVADAQKAYADHSEERSAQIAKNNNAVEASYIRLQFAAAHAASEQLGALNSVRGAELSLVAAEQHLAELEGRPPSAAAKQNLALAQAQQAVDNARKADADARVAQQEKAANAALKQRQLEQEYADLARKAAKDARDDAEQRVKDENAIKEAVIARAEAEERAYKFAQSNVGSIRGVLDQIISGNKDVSAQVNLTEVSIENLRKGLFAVAAEASKNTPPTGIDALRAAARLFTADTEKQITTQQRLALVTRLAGSSFSSLGHSAAEILNVIEHNSKAFEELAKKAENLDKGIDADAHKIEAFRGALASFELTISQLSQAFAAAISPTFTKFLTDLEESIKNTDGLLHSIIEGIKGVGIVLGEGIRGWLELGRAIEKAFNLKPGTFMQAFLLVLTGLVAAFASAWLAVPAAIALVLVAVGDVKTAWEAAKLSLTDNAVVRFWERLLDVIAKVKSLLTGGGWKNPAGASASPGSAATNEQGAAQAAAVGREAGADLGTVRGFATGGGPINGPGTTTSDSIMARLSRGEFVIKAAAVQNYGANLFHALNNMMIPGFASGGLVPSPVRMGGGAIAPATSTLNLSIDGRSFNGLRGPKSTIDDLSSFAISRQTSAAGSNPSWMK